MTLSSISVPLASWARGLDTLNYLELLIDFMRIGKLMLNPGKMEVLLARFDYAARDSLASYWTEVYLNLQFRSGLELSPAFRWAGCTIGQRHLLPT